MRTIPRAKHCYDTQPLLLRVYSMSRIHSMTGYALVAHTLSTGSLQLELRTVNARYLDIQLRIPEELRLLEPILREAISARLSRGKVDCRASFSTAAAGDAAHSLNTEAMAQLQQLSSTVRSHFPDASPLRVADVLRWPGVLAESRISEDALRAAATTLANTLLDELAAARQREGARLANVIRERVGSIRARLTDVAPEVPQAIAQYQEKLSQRLREVMGSGDDERIRQEIAVFAMKIDVDEEMQRLITHLDEVERILDQGGAAGKRLDFLMQELNREANTLGAKAASRAISQCALELKLLIEQMREQVQNIE